MVERSCAKKGKNFVSAKKGELECSIKKNANVAFLFGKKF
jgi:hypothetical protein